MSARAATRLAWPLWATAITLVAGGLLLAWANRLEAPLYEFWIVALISPTFATLGALIVSRRPGNVIGWIFLACGVVGGVQMFSGQYATVALLSERPSRLPGGAVAGWLSTLVQHSLVTTIVLLVLLFPTGRLLSPRWRPFALFAGTAIVVWVVSSALRPGPLEHFAPTRNPFGVEDAAAVVDLLEAIGGWVGLACVVATILSLILRFYRSRGDERQQLKWFVYAATLGFLAIGLAGETPIIGELVWLVAPLSLPVAAGIAILKYRLYDIDRIINRTLVYAALTAVLALVYVGGVISLQYGFRILTGGESQLAVVASTLAIAALFSPLRRRVQAFVDRRFYRRKYDSAKTLEAFSTKLRAETDLDSLSGDLLGVVHETMRPEHASLWLRPATGREPGKAERSR
jgi:hypothetical protein